MFRKLTIAVCTVSALVVSTSCSTSGTPTSPAPAEAGTDAAADGSTLKVTAPLLASPINTVQLDTLSPLFTLNNSSARFGPTPALVYRFEVSTPAGEVVRSSGQIAAGPGTTKWQLPVDLILDNNYRWRARAELGTAVGPWSAYGTFRSLDYRGLNPRPIDGKWPTTPSGFIDYMNQHWDEYMDVTALTATRLEHMEFLRDRLIELGICGGYDLAWNRKRGDFNAARSHDAVAWRKPNGFVEVVDIASAFDDKTIPLQMNWSIVNGPPGYERYTNHPGC